ncbi:alpha/beta hydrolase [Oceanivirga salmonicida]|uniref:alpha/beta hydrolase n=1 Tax=Oceanivirga salmonicida TaxID=1769291 RepID=UPI0012E1500E|nr:alpha/beta hydrolase family protein [Oceanivirga salmonicida]
MKKLLCLFICLISTITFSHIEKNIEVYSKSMKKKIPVTVVLPDKYNQNERYSIIYALHGWSGSNRNYVEKVNIGKLADQYNVMYVFPDGGYDSWYIDSKIAKNSKYETFIGKELVKYIDENYSTYNNYKQRAITGLSMGGFGAFYISINNPKTFGAIGSMSGGFDVERFKLNWGIQKYIGNDFENYNIKNLATKLIFSGSKIIFDCGISDFFIETNRELHNELIKLNIAHDYIERDGTHSWVYWTNSIKYQTLFFVNNFESNK